MITIDDVLKCKKTITRRRKPDFQIDQRHYRMNLDLACKELDLKMVMFLRKLIEIPEDFTIGLRINGPSFFADRTVVIVRFQGPHGGQSSSKSLNDLHNNYHIHLYTEQDRVRHRKLASYKESGKFNSFEQALVDFMQYCNIEDTYDIFENEVATALQYEMDLKDL